MTAPMTAAQMSNELSRSVSFPISISNDLSGIPMSSFLMLAPQMSWPKPSRKKVIPIVAMNKMMRS